MSVNLSKIKPGDILTVRLVAVKCTPCEDADNSKGWVADGDGNVCVEIFDGDMVEQTAWVSPRWIVAHDAKPLAAGDRVARGGHAGEIIAIRNGTAWVQWDAHGGSEPLCPVSTLDRDQ